MTTKESDRELLTLAAKAAGYVVHGLINDIFIVNFGEGERGAWDPLQDDGDAFRLAVKLGLKIDMNFYTGSDQQKGVGVWLPDEADCYSPSFWTAAGNDINRTARETITRAAAAIGKEK